MLEGGQTQYTHQAALLQNIEQLKKEITMVSPKAMTDAMAAPGTQFTGDRLSYYMNPDLLLPRPTPRRQKRIVPEGEKDGRYWEKRQRNNEAARRSRENKRRLDLDVRQRVILLEEENELLRKELALLKHKFQLPTNERFIRLDDNNQLVGEPHDESDFQRDLERLERFTDSPSNENDSGSSHSPQESLNTCPSEASFSSLSSSHSDRNSHTDRHSHSDRNSHNDRNRPTGMEISGEDQIPPKKRRRNQAEINFTDSDDSPITSADPKPAQQNNTTSSDSGERESYEQHKNGWPTRRNSLEMKAPYESARLVCPRYRPSHSKPAEKSYPHLSSAESISSGYSSSPHSPDARREESYYRPYPQHPREPVTSPLHVLPPRNEQFLEPSGVPRMAPPTHNETSYMPEYMKHSSQGPPAPEQLMSTPASDLGQTVQMKLENAELRSRMQQLSDEVAKMRDMIMSPPIPSPTPSRHSNDPQASPSMSQRSSVASPQEIPKSPTM